MIFLLGHEHTSNPAWSKLTAAVSPTDAPAHDDDAGHLQLLFASATSRKINGLAGAVRIRWR
jgi:hypothetical protein